MVVIVVHIVLTSTATVLAATNYLMLGATRVKAHGYTTVEDVEFPEEILVRVQLHVADNATFELENLSKAFIEEKTRGLFAAHTTGTHCHNCFVT
jgi:hypothetical protein